MLIMQVTWETDVLLPERCSPYTTVRFRGSADVKAASPLSTTESEFISAAEATKEAIWLNRILTELGVGELPVTLKCDNQGAIALIHDPVFHQRTKHIDVRFFFVRDAQAESKVNISYIETENQLADIFTKALAAPRFEKLRSSLNICEL